MIWTRSLFLVNRFIENIAMTFLVGATLVILMQIISRSLIGYSFAFTDELSRYLFIWFVFLGASSAFRYGSHISIEVFFDRLSPVVQTIMQILITLLCLILFAVIILAGWDIVINSMGISSTTLKIPMGYIYLVIPISGVLQMIYLIDVTIQFVKTRKLPREEEF